VGSSIRADLAPVTGLADDLAGDLLTELLGDISFAVKKQALHIGERVTGGDRRLSRFGGKKSRGKTKLGVNYQLSAARSVINMKPAAMWALTTGGARAHMIGTGKRTRTGRYSKARGGRRVVVFAAAATSAGRGKPSRVRTGPVRHPGSRGRASLDRVYAQVPRIVTETIDEALTERLR
jgi:hypothetical protein